MSEGFRTFDPVKETITSYLNRFNHFLRTKQLPAGGDGEELRKSWLLRVIGAGPSNTLDALCFPETTDTKPYVEILALHRSHYAPAKNKNSERKTFYSRRQLSGESLADFAVTLRHLVRYCEFGTFLDQALHTQFINNLQNTQRKDYIANGAANFQSLVDLASIKESQLHTPSDPAVHWVPPSNGKKQFKRHPGPPSSGPPSSNSSGPRSAPQSRHLKQQTPHNPQRQPQQQKSSSTHQNIRCNNCNQYGHYSSNCGQPQKPRTARKTVHHIQDNSGGTSSVSHGGGPLDLWKIESSSFPSKIQVLVTINGVKVVMELDTGCKGGLIGRSLYNQHFPHIPLKPTADMW